MTEVWIDRGPAQFGEVDIRTVWRKIGPEWKRLSAHAIIRTPTLCRLVDIERTKP